MLHGPVADMHPLVVWGAAGIGKTTIAKATFDRLAIHFKAQYSYFLPDVKTMFGELDGQLTLQRKLISNLIQNDESQIHIYSYHQGIRRIERIIKHQIELFDVKPTRQAAIELWVYLRTNFFDPFVDLVGGLETRVTCIVCDWFMTYTNMISASEKLRVPIILFWTMAACGFMGFYQAKVLTEKGLIPLKDESDLTSGYLEMKTDWIPGMERIRLKDLPEFKLLTKANNPVFDCLQETAQAADKFRL